MPKFTRNPQRIAELKLLRDAIEEELRERTKFYSEHDSFRMAEVLIWLRLRDGSIVHGRLMQVHLDCQDEWRSQQPTARGSIYLLRLRGDKLFWVDLLEVREALFRQPRDFAATNHPLG